MMKRAIKIYIGHDISFDQLIKLYTSVGWTTYTNKENCPELLDALQNSTYVVSAWNGDDLVGLARALSDDVSIFYLQDILVHPEFQKQGVGRQLLGNCLERFEHVRMKVLLTDAEDRQEKFYESMGYKNTRYLRKPALNAFVQIRGIDLE